MKSSSHKPTKRVNTSRPHPKKKSSGGSKHRVRKPTSGAEEPLPKVAKLTTNTTRSLKVNGSIGTGNNASEHKPRKKPEGTRENIKTTEE